MKRLIPILFLLTSTIYAEEMSSPGGVTKITAGTGVTLTPTSGKGDVTIDVSAIVTATNVVILDGNQTITSSKTFNGGIQLNTSIFGTSMYGTMGSTWVGKVTAGQFSGDGSQITGLKSANMDNWKSTMSYQAQFNSTDTVNVLGLSTFTFCVDNDITVVGWRMRSNGAVVGNAKVAISSAAFGEIAGRIDGTDIPDLVAQTSSSSTALTGWITNVGRGGCLKFVLYDLDDLIGGFVIDIIATKWAK